MADGDVVLLIPGLPDDISVRCIARLPLSSHPTLCHVSRSWRSLLLSPSLFTVRSLLPISYPILTLSIRSPSGLSTWHHLPLPLHHPYRPFPLPLPSPPLPTVGSSAVPLGPLLFLLGGSHNNILISTVQIYDSRHRRWSRGPHMLSSREFSAAGSINGKIYTVGGCLPSSSSWAESLDPAAARPKWTPLPSPYRIREKWMHGSAVLNEKLLAVADRGGIIYNPAAGAGTWDAVPASLDLEWRGRAAAVGDILYTYDYVGRIRGYNWDLGEWREVEGLEKELPRFLCGAVLVEFGGLLCLVWEGKGRERGKEMEISCAGVDISRTESGGLKGEVVWMELAVMKVPKGSSVSHCVTLEL